MEAGAALLAGGARVAGAAAAQPARPAELVQGTVGVTVAGCNRARFRPWAPVGGPPAPPRPSAHRGSQGSHDGQSGSGHNEGHQTRAGTGSGQPRRSPRAASLQGCSHTLRSGEAHSGPEPGRPGPRPHAHPGPLGWPCSRWQSGKWK